MEKLNGKDFKLMVRSGCASLTNNQKEIDALNVFPVPDGDTGTNMSMTFTNGLKNVESCESETIGDVAKALSKGLLMGARGNSGVITSQIFRGFYQSVKEKEEIDAKDLAEAFANGSKVAYKAIMKPVEGTILTVIREGSENALKEVGGMPECTIDQYFEILDKYAKESLANTPELLPVLKEVGVVDSGGTGLVKIFEGFKAYIDGNPIEPSDGSSEESANTADDKDEKGYSVEYVLYVSEEIKEFFKEEKLLKKLNELGRKVSTSRSGDAVKVSVTTSKPGDALNVGQRYGELGSLNIVNLQEKNFAKPEEKPVEAPKEEKEFGIITVCAGKGLTDLFVESGADVVISGGQTMNPSTEDFVNKINELDHCKHIFVFPNNSNIILAAKQAQDIMPEKDIIVVETKSIQAGLSCLMMFDHEGTVESNTETMNEINSNIRTASITYAIKDTTFENVEVKKGDYIAMANKSIVASNTDETAVILKCLDSLFEGAEDCGLLTVIAGETSNESITAEIEKYVSENFEAEIDVIQGDQPVYDYLFGLE